MEMSAITQTATKTSAEAELLRLDLKMIQLINKSLEHENSQLKELLATKTRVCEMQYKLIKLLESQKEAHG